MTGLPMRLPDRALDRAIEVHREASVHILNRPVAPIPSDADGIAKERRVMAETISAFLREWL